METFWPWGVATADFDNDGFEDVFLPSGMGYPFDYWPSALMMNTGRGAFVDRAKESGIEPPRGGRYMDRKIGGHRAARSSRCAATGDFDGDGRMDVVANNFNDHPHYFKNQFPNRNSVRFRLIGTQSNRDAIGRACTQRGRGPPGPRRRRLFGPIVANAAFWLATRPSTESKFAGRAVPSRPSAPRMSTRSTN